MPTILIAIPFGQAVRDVLRTDTFRLLADSQATIVVAIQGDTSDLAITKEFERPNVVWDELPISRPPRVERLAHHIYSATFTGTNVSHGSAHRNGSAAERIGRRVARLGCRLWGPEQMRARSRRMLLHVASEEAHERLLARHRPDVVVVTRVLAFASDYGVLKSAWRRGIRTVALASSWDNFTSHGFYAFPPDSLVVWNRVMEAEATGIAGYPRRAITISGPPRFDRYFRREALDDRETYFRKLDLDPCRPLVTFTAGYLGLMPSPQEIEIIEFLAEGLSAPAAGGATPQVLVRLHPYSDPREYDPLLRRDDLVVRVPGVRAGFLDRVFTDEDEAEFGETMWHSDVVVNVASTVTIDAAIFDTPTVCVGFDSLTGNLPYEASVRRYYDYPHYVKLAQTGGFRTAWSAPALLAEVAAYLDDPDRDAAGRARIRQEQCHHVDGLSGRRVAEHVLRVAQGEFDSTAGPGGRR